MGILDKATLTLGDNREVDFSRAMIFMTSNLGAADMDRLLRPNLGFAPAHIDNADERLARKLDHAGTTAARRRFTPEFMNRIDRVVAFHALGEKELWKILDIELNLVQQRIFDAGSGLNFVFDVTSTAREFLLREGTNVRYGARHLKRAIEQNLVNPLSNLIASGKVRSGDLIVVDYDGDEELTFFREAAGLEAAALAKKVDQIYNSLPLLPPRYSINASTAKAAGASDKKH